MRTQRLALALVLALPVLAAGSTAGALGSPGASPPPLQAWGLAPGTAHGVSKTPTTGGATQLRLVGTGFSTTSVDNPPAGTGQGDSIAVNGRLATLRGRGAGDMQALETVTQFTGTGGRLLVTFVSQLTAGQITAAGMVKVKNGKAGVLRAAIVGGTGRYLRARGQVVVMPLNNGTTLFTYVMSH